MATKDYFDALDEAYRAVDACGGVGAPKEKVEALDAVCLYINSIGGMDPDERKRKGYPFDHSVPNDRDDAFFRIYPLEVGHMLTTQNVADIQQVLADHNNLIGEQVNLLHAAKEEALFAIGGEELVLAVRSVQAARTDEVVRRAMEKFYEKRKALS